MTTAEFLTHLRKLDIKVWVEGERLKFNAPAEAVTDDLKNELASRKDDLLDFLKKQDLRVSVSVKPVERVSRDKNLPASFGQRPLWFLEQLEPANVSNYIPCGMHLSGPVDKDVLEKCINEIIRRHEVLRTNFTVADDQPVQVVNPHHEFVVEWLDLQDVSVADHTGMLQRLTTEEIRRPFDLSEDLLLRVKLFRLAKDEHILLLTVHHLVFDGASFGVFFQELSILYQAYIGGGDSPLNDLPYQYVDYSAWQGESMQDEVIAQQLGYWHKQLGGRLPVLELPTDRLRPSIQSYNGARQPLRIGSDTHQRLKSFGQQEGCTLFMSMVSVLQALLYRYTGQDDIILGSPISNRTLPDSEKLIGMFLNMLVLRTNLEGNPSFRELLKRVRDVTLDAYSNQDVPFDQIVRSLQVDRDPSRNPVFQVLLQLSPAEGYVLDLPGISVSPIKVDTEAAQFDLVLHLFEEEAGIVGHFEYNTDLFSADTMMRTAIHFNKLLESALADPDTPISTLSILDDEELRQLARWNDTGAEIPEVAGLYQLFEAQATKTPDALAVTFVNQKLTYRELNERANQLAHHLRTIGVTPDQLVGLFVERSLDMLVGVLGIMKSGAAYVPLDPAYPQDRLAFMLADSGANLLVTESTLLSRRPVDDITTICLDSDWAHIGTLPSDNLQALSGPDNLAYAIYTSGSTGMPKGVLIPHRSAVNFLWSMSKKPGLCPEDTLLAVTTLSFDIAVLELYLPLCIGAHCHIVPLETAVDAGQLVNALAESGATAMQATPITYRMLLEADWLGHKHLKILCGGEALDSDLAGKLLPRCSELWNMYGPTETTVWSMIHQIRHDDASILIGHPIANTRVHILDDHLQPVPVGVTGELYIGGEGLARGYHNRPDLTAERFIPNPFDDDQKGRLYNTGDMARRRSDGMVECLGRVDFQVKVRGYRIELGEIESAMVGFEDLKQAVVVAR
ncbi:MAG: amino acid adenylation domain-containing protein, partial [Candidatus Latescibacteria bacterium]|nr:amino acid adenylation domain-containing protein [Candidatus Latescibacterota bacterium]